MRNRICLGLLIGLTVLLAAAAAPGAELRAKKRPTAKLHIQRDAESGTVIVSWNGKGMLTQTSPSGHRLKPLRKHGNALALAPVEEQAIFRLEAANDGVIISVNAVGYVNLQLPPGLSLIANPLYYTNNTLAFWWPQAPDGAQVFKYVEGSGYEVSTFDGIEQRWSNPDLDVSIGTGFFFRNPSSTTVTQTFVGEVPQGTLVNPLPAGLSTKGSLVPQAGSINDLHHIPGQAGDELRTWTNDLQGGGSYNISLWSQPDNAWVPDQELGVGQGFWIHKQNPQNWVRIFFVN